MTDPIQKLKALIADAGSVRKLARTIEYTRTQQIQPSPQSIGEALKRGKLSVELSNWVERAYQERGK